MATVSGFLTRPGPPGLAGRNFGSSVGGEPGWITVVGPPVLIRFGSPPGVIVPPTPEEVVRVTGIPKGPLFKELTGDERDIMEILAIWMQIKDD